MKRYIVVISVFMTCLLLLSACGIDGIEFNISDDNITLGDAVLEESKTYDIKSDIISLDIEINAADFTIEHGESICVESNLKYLDLSEKNGVLILRDNAKGGSDYTGAKLRLCLPENIILDDVDITTGAANLKADHLSANSLELKLGAGRVEFGRLDAGSDIEIKGGAGEIVIHSGTLKELELGLGVGRLDLTAKLLSDCNLQFGIGDSDLTLIGSMDDYSVDIEKGIGSISFNGDDIFSSGIRGSGENHVDIEGGIGAINVSFRDE